MYYVPITVLSTENSRAPDFRSLHSLAEIDKKKFQYIIQGTTYYRGFKKKEGE